DGRAGSLLVQAGNLIKANDTTLVNINQLQPIYVTFSVPEQLLTEIRNNSTNGRNMEVTAVLSPEARLTGQLTFIDNLVDNTTGTIKLKALFANANHGLWPGQFVNVVVTLRTLKDAIVIPSEAVQAGQKGQFVYIVKPDQTVESRIVQPGETIDNLI